jgi:hypothetical protein
VQLSLGLALAFISAITVNCAYSRAHDAAAYLPPFSPQHARRFVSLLLSDRRWLSDFATDFQLAAFAALIASAVLLARTRSVPAGARSPAASSTAHALTG